MIKAVGAVLGGGERVVLSLVVVVVVSLYSLDAPRGRSSTKQDQTTGGGEWHSPT